MGSATHLQPGYNEAAYQPADRVRMVTVTRFLVVSLLALALAPACRASTKPAIEGGPPPQAAATSTPDPHPLSIGSPQIVIDSDVPGHYAERARELWPTLLEAFPHQARTCLGDVHLEFLDEQRLVSHGHYHWPTATIVVRPTGHITLLLLHELGHHLDLQCTAETEIGAEFRQVMGLEDQPWYVSEVGVAEIFADAVRDYLRGWPHPASDLLHTWATAGGEEAVRPAHPEPPPPDDFPTMEFGP